MRIRDDLVGSVYVHTPKGTVMLVAGDQVPDGVRIDQALVVEEPRKVTRGGSRARKPQ